jgi:major membrane immunogen (membrane-anchored lipoprotein)
MGQTKVIDGTLCSLKIDFKEPRGENKIQHDIQRTLNYKISTISEKNFSRFINTLNKLINASLSGVLHIVTSALIVCYTLII